MRYEGRDQVEQRNRRQLEEEKAREDREINERIEQAKPAQPSEKTDDYPESRVQMQQYYRDGWESGSVRDGQSGNIRHYAYPGIEITPKGDAFGSYKDVREFLTNEQLSGARGQEMLHLEAHHLLKGSQMETFGFRRDEGMSVAVYSHEHMETVHGKDGIDFQLPNHARYDIWDVVETHVRTYNNIERPEWGEKAKEYVRQNKDRILQAYRDGTVLWATPEYVRKVEQYLNRL